VRLALPSLDYPEPLAALDPETDYLPTTLPGGILPTYESLVERIPFHSTEDDEEEIVLYWGKIRGKQQPNDRER
jgi:hypothetical protein